MPPVSEITALLEEVRRMSDLSARWLKISDACRYAKLSRGNLTALLNSGEIRGRLRPIGGWIVDRRSIDEYNAGGEDRAVEDLIRRAGL
jgi:hypothetical protein